jgi:uncharacterized protein
MKKRKVKLMWVAIIIFSLNCSFVCFASSWPKKDSVIIKCEISENGLKADFFFQKDTQNQKGLILLGGSEGGKPARQINEHIKDLVTSGYAVLSLAYFNYEGLPATLQLIPLEYFDKSIRFLQSQEMVQAAGITVIGGSKGGELALLLASYNSAVESVVAISPSAYVFEGIGGPNGIEDVVSSWSIHGSEVPFLPYCSSGDTWQRAFRTGNFLKVHQEALSKKAQYTSAAIEVENIRGSIILVSGKRDNMWPSYEMCNEIEKRLMSNGFPYRFEHLSYDVGHNVLNESKSCWSEILTILKSESKK